MSIGKYLFPFLAVLIIGCTYAYMGYMKGQRDALNGIYRIDRQERDMIDPQGLRHHLATGGKKE